MFIQRYYINYSLLLFANLFIYNILCYDIAQLLRRDELTHCALGDVASFDYWTFKRETKDEERPNTNVLREGQLAEEVLGFLAEIESSSKVSDALNLAAKVVQYYRSMFNKIYFFIVFDGIRDFFTHRFYEQSHDHLFFGEMQELSILAKKMHEFSSECFAKLMNREDVFGVAADDESKAFDLTVSTY